MPDVSTLVGAWNLLLWTVTEGGVVRHPFGEHPTGTLLYTTDGWMSAVVSAGDRPRLSTEPPRRAPADELAGAFLSFFCYSGRWRVEGDWVVHTVEVALNPAMVGTEQRRRIEFGPGRGACYRRGRFGSDRSLELVADEHVGDRRRQHRLGWYRPGIE